MSSARSVCAEVLRRGEDVARLRATLWELPLFERLLWTQAVARSIALSEPLSLVEARRRQLVLLALLQWEAPPQVRTVSAEDAGVDLSADQEVWLLVRWVAREIVLKTTDPVVLRQALERSLPLPWALPSPDRIQRRQALLAGRKVIEKFLSWRPGVFAPVGDSSSSLSLELEVASVESRSSFVVLGDSRDEISATLTRGDGRVVVGSARAVLPFQKRRRRCVLNFDGADEERRGESGAGSLRGALQAFERSEPPLGCCCHRRRPRRCSRCACYSDGGAPARPGSSRIPCAGQPSSFSSLTSRLWAGKQQLGGCVFWKEECSLSSSHSALSARIVALHTPASFASLLSPWKPLHRLSSALASCRLPRRRQLRSSV